MEYSPRHLVLQWTRRTPSALSWTAQSGDWKTIDQFLRSGSDPNKLDASEESPLHWSPCAEDSTCLQLLLEVKADVELKTTFGRTALCSAANDGVGMAFVDILLKFGASIESEDIYGQTPLHRATIGNHNVMLTSLFQKGADINAINLRGLTALHLALIYHSYDVLRMLLEDAKLHYNVEYAGRCTLLHYSTYYADIETLNILKSRCLDELDCTETWVMC